MLRFYIYKILCLFSICYLSNSDKWPHFSYCLWSVTIRITYKLHHENWLKLVYCLSIYKVLIRSNIMSMYLVHFLLSLLFKHDFQNMTFCLFLFEELLEKQQQLIYHIQNRKWCTRTKRKEPMAELDAIEFHAS